MAQHKENAECLLLLTKQGVFGIFPRSSYPDAIRRMKGCAPNAYKGRFADSQLIRRERMTTAHKPPDREMLEDDEDEPRLCSVPEKGSPTKGAEIKLRLVENKVSTSLGDHPVLIRLRQQMAEKENMP